MLLRVNFYSICFAFGLSVLLILAGSRYTDNTNYRPVPESRRNIRNYFKFDDGDESSVPVTTNPFDSVEKIFEQIREEIWLSNYNLTQLGVKKVSELLMENGGNPKRSLIISTWRSGTTFLGEILSSIPGNFYHYEPLLNYDIIQIRGPPHADSALSVIKKMLKCNFEGMESYFEFGKTHLHQFNHNTRLWDHCRVNKELCFDADFTSKFCKLFPMQSMKVVRLRLRLIENVLEDKELNVKVVMLIRDPRGVMQSRHHRDFCQLGPDCWQPELLCADMISDYVAAARLMQTYPDRVMALRYEDLALNCNTTTHRLFKFLGLPITYSVERFLQTHTNVDSGGVSSTFRVSKEVPFKWKNTLNFTYVEEVQFACQEAMELWGYRLAHNSTHMASKDFNPLKSFTINL